MSFDFKLTDGDITFGSDGNPEIVEGIDKLKQDIGKILITRKGKDPGDAQFGSKLPDLLGQKFDPSILQGLVGKSVAEAINFLQSLQFVQSTKQVLTFQEVISTVDALAVSSPTFGRLQVDLAVTTFQGTRELFSIKLGAQADAPAR